MCGQYHAPAVFTPGKEPVPIVQEAGWASGPVWTGAEDLAPPGFDPWTVQPLGCHYTDYATQLTNACSYIAKLHSDWQLHWGRHGFYKQRSYHFYKMGDMVLIVCAGLLS